MTANLPTRPSLAPSGVVAADLENFAAELTEAAFRWPCGMGSAGHGSN
jgi:hypothetical protein